MLTSGRPTFPDRPRSYRSGWRSALFILQLLGIVSFLCSGQVQASNTGTQQYLSTTGAAASVSALSAWIAEEEDQQATSLSSDTVVSRHPAPAVTVQLHTVEPFHAAVRFSPEFFLTHAARAPPAFLVV